MVILVLVAASKHHRLGGLETTEIYRAQFQRPEVRDQGASVVGLEPSSGAQSFVVSPLGVGVREPLFVRALISFLRAPPS